MQRTVVVAIIVGILGGGYVPRADAMPPLAVAAVRHVAVFLLDYAAGKILDRVLQGPARESRDPHVAAMQSEVREFRESLETIRSDVSRNSAGLVRLEARVDALEAQNQIAQASYSVGASELRRIRRGRADRAGIDDLYLSIPSRIDEILNMQNRQKARELARELALEIQERLPVLEGQQPLEQFISESIRLADEVQDKLATHTQELLNVQTQTAHNADAIAELARGQSIILAESFRVEDRIMRRVELQRTPRKKAASVIVIEKDYSSIDGVLFFTQLEREIGRSCPNAVLFGSKPLPSEAPFIEVLGTIRYDISCSRHAALGEQFRRCEWKALVDGRSTRRELDNTVYGADATATDTTLRAQIQTQFKRVGLCQ